MDRIVCFPCAAQRGLDRDRYFRAPPRRDRSGVGLASGRSAPDGCWHGDAISPPGPFDRTGGGLESDAGFCCRTHSLRDSARCRDREARGLARAFRPPGCRPGGVDLAERAVLEGPGDPRARLLWTFSDSLCRFPILLSAERESVVVGDQCARPGAPVLAVLPRYLVRLP